MAYITVTNSFTNGTTASASEVNTNFTDIINGTSDGTKDFSINALTVAGTFTANGNCTFGNASSDDLTFTGSLASDLPIKTNTTYDIGSSTLGLAELYMGASSTFTTKIVSDTQTASRVVTIPAVDTNTSFLLKRGTQTNDSATAGDIGERLSGSVSTTNFPATGDYGDLTSVSLTAGDWDVSAVFGATLNGATVTFVVFGISTTSGNSATGLTLGDNFIGLRVPAASNDTGGSIAGYRISLSATTTVYLKYRSTYTGGPPQAYGRISAIRVR